MLTISLALSNRPRLLCPGGGVSDGEDGVADSLGSLLLDDRYGAPGSAERGLVKLLARAFFKNYLYSLYMYVLLSVGFNK
jgi:hypothetical protein